MKIFVLFFAETSADAAGAIPLHVGMPVFVLFHRAQVAAVAPPQITAHALAHGLHQLKTLARFQRVLLGEQDAVLRQRRRDLAAFSARRRRQRLITGLPHDRQDIQLQIGFGDLALAQHIKDAEKDIRFSVGGRDAQPVLDEGTGQIAAAG